MIKNELQKTDVNKQVVSVKQYIEGFKDLFASALPRHIEVDRLMRLTVTTLRKQPELLDCTRESLIGALIECAGWGLEPYGGLTWLVPRYNKKIGRNEVSFQLGYKGIVELVMRSGKVSWVNAYCVYDNEQFEVKYGTEPNIYHIPLPPKDRGELKGAYAVFKLLSGDTQFSVMWKEEIEKRKDVAKTDYVWRQWTEEMWKKTAVHNGSKFLQLSSEIHETISRDNTVINFKAEKEKEKEKVLDGEFYEEDIALTPPEVDE